MGKYDENLLSKKISEFKNISYNQQEIEVDCESHELHEVKRSIKETEKQKSPGPGGISVEVFE